ncbi:MAG: hypothetical protein IKP62_11090 [Salinivirgaceae bacterium]|nr:hypothetical protein [Salinivirgaceae bacterium]
MKHLLKFEAKIVALAIVTFGIVNISCDKEDDVKQEVEQENQQEPTNPQQDTVAENKKEQIEVKDSTIINKQDSIEIEKQKQDSVLNTIERQKKLLKAIVEKDYTLKVKFYYEWYYSTTGFGYNDIRRDSLIISNNIHLSLNEDETEIILYEDSLFNWKFTNIKFDNDNFSFDVKKYAKNLDDYVERKINKLKCIYNKNECEFELYIYPESAWSWDSDYYSSPYGSHWSDWQTNKNIIRVMLSNYYRDIEEKDSHNDDRGWGEVKVSDFFYDGKSYSELVLEEN